MLEASQPARFCFVFCCIHRLSLWDVVRSHEIAQRTCNYHEWKGNWYYIDRDTSYDRTINSQQAFVVIDAFRFIRVGKSSENLISGRFWFVFFCNGNNLAKIWMWWTKLVADMTEDGLMFISLMIQQHAAPCPTIQRVWGEEKKKMRGRSQISQRFDFDFYMFPRTSLLLHIRSSSFFICCNIQIF